ncbi:hypothetical protein ONS95_010368 [Cadophora gregata]|uniref:uncharacterized protein n=1 Tax=Cadophora gregata TaxID=51156 RepID=UPI0026DA8278|nr:uncharacterized protein ONS95_010368 [Cadophora gregata]KAK0122106.1 hypothetical protein ONS95_010368 [Cadophora gregata]
MGDAAVFNSSDFEVSGDDQPAKKRKTGHGIAEAILRNQLIDRRESKKASRTLKFAHGAPGTRSLHDAVLISWDAYCQTIGHPVKECPSGERIFQYIDTMIRNSKSTIAGKPSISLSVVRALLSRLIKLLMFRHENLLESYTKHHLTRIEVHLQQLVTKGKLVRGTWYRKQWLSFMTLLRMGQGWFKRVMAEGTYSWDIVLSKIASIVTQSALSSRSGDITRTQLYEGFECLCWKDITLKLDESSDRGMPRVIDLRGTFMLRFTKGFKDVRNADQPIYCDPLSNTSHSTVCCVKLLLILALRLGYVYSPTLDGVLRGAAARADGTIQWTQPDAPVFSQFSKGFSPFLVLDKPAGQEQVRHSLKEIAHLTGMLEDRIDTRALRRGALRDHAYAKKALVGAPTVGVAMLANHSNTSYNMGTTRDYVGPLEVSSYNQRSEAERADRMAPAFADEGPSKEWLRKFSTREISEYMTENGMDLNDRMQRKTAGARMKKEREQKWRDVAKDNPLRLQTASEANVGGTKGSHAKKKSTLAPTVASSSTNDTDDVDIDSSIEVGLRTLDIAPHTSLESLTDAVFLDRGENSSDDDSKISDSVGDDTADEIDLVLQDTLALEFQSASATASVSTFLAPLQGVQLAHIEQFSGDDFVRFFSQINLYQSTLSSSRFNRNDPEDLKKYTLCGNSRDVATPWMYPCPHGCGYSSISEHNVEEHEVNCNGQARERPVPCPRKNCGKSFKNEETMKAHVHDVHDYRPIACEQCPDQPDVLYDTKLALRNHREKAHSDPIPEQDCPLVADCKFTTKFTSKRALKKHLKSKSHKLTTAQLKEHVRDSRSDRRQKVGKKNRPKGWYLEQNDDEEDE